jgi:hypothetical protein
MSALSLYAFKRKLNESLLANPFRYREMERHDSSKDPRRQNSVLRRDAKTSLYTMITETEIEIT